MPKAPVFQFQDGTGIEDRYRHTKNLLKMETDYLKQLDEISRSKASRQDVYMETQAMEREAEALFDISKLDPLADDYDKKSLRYAPMAKYSPAVARALDQMDGQRDTALEIHGTIAKEAGAAGIEGEEYQDLVDRANDFIRRGQPDKIAKILHIVERRRQEKIIRDNERLHQNRLEHAAAQKKDTAASDYAKKAEKFQEDVNKLNYELEDHIKDSSRVVRKVIEGGKKTFEEGAREIIQNEEVGAEDFDKTLEAFKSTNSFTEFKDTLKYDVSPNRIAPLYNNLKSWDKYNDLQTKGVRLRSRMDSLKKPSQTEAKTEAKTEAEAKAEAKTEAEAKAEAKEAAEDIIGRVTTKFYDKADSLLIE